MSLSARVQAKAEERRWWILGVLCFSLLVIVLDNSILNVALPTIVRDLDASNSQLQWMVDSYTLVFAGLLLTAGSLGDRFGRRPALQLGFAIFGLGSLASAMAGSAEVLIGTRAFMGIGGAFIMPSTLSIITNVFHGPERGRAIGVWAATAGAGAALGPLTGGVLLQHFYWGSIFLVNVPIVALGLLAGLFLIPDSKDPAQPRLDPIGAVLSIAGLCAVLYAIIEAPSRGWLDTITIVGFLVGAGLLVLFLLWELRSDHPMLNVGFFRNPRFSAASAAVTLTFFAMFGSLFVLTQYLQFVLGYDALQTGVRLLAFAVPMMIVAPLSARIVDWIGSKVVVAVGMSLTTAGLVSMTGMGPSSSFASFGWRMVVTACGLALTMAPATDSIMGSLPLAKAGVGSAVNDTTRQVGGALGVAVIGSVFASIYDSHVDNALAARGLPADALAQARDSIGGALQVAARLGGPDAQDIVHAARQAFVDGMHAGFYIGAVITAIGIVVTLVWLPAREHVDERAETEHEGADVAAAQPAP